jgi:hypothetical protein
MYSNKSQKRSKKKLFFLIAGAGLALLVLLFVLEITHVINLYSKKQPVATDAKTTSTAPTAQEDFTEGGERPIARSDKTEGIIQDTGGTAPSTDQAQWSSSSDGAITVYMPAKNDLITSGGTLSGASNLSKVSFRLIDDVSGVIAQGSLTVVNGKFSGSFSFSTNGTNGRLDIFSAAPDGVESSNVEIPVRFR